MNKLDKWHEDTGEVLKKSLTALTEVIPGIASTDKKELALSVGHVLQSLRKGQFLSKLLEEWNSYRDKGRIKDDYMETEQHMSCLQEILNFIDNDFPDQIRFDAMKKVFLGAASEMQSDRESPLPYEYLKLCRQLSSGDVIVLSTMFTIETDGTLNEKNMNVGGNLIGKIAERSDLRHSELVGIHIDNLSKKGFTTPPQSLPRLTGLGREFCEYILSYEIHSSR